MDVKRGFSKEDAINVDTDSDSECGDHICNQLDCAELCSVTKPGVFKKLDYDEDIDMQKEPLPNAEIKKEKVIILDDDDNSDEEEIICKEVPKKRKLLDEEQVTYKDVPKNRKLSDHQPVYEIPPEKYSAEQILKFYSILILKVCKGKPRDITSSATYVVDTSYLDSIDDVKKDEFGIWRYMGSHPQSFKVFIDEDGEINIEKCSKNSSGSNIFHLRRLHCCHPSNSDFKRTICYISDSSSSPHRFCLITYRLSPGFIPTLSPHGNSKELKPFIQLGQVH